METVHSVLVLALTTCWVFIAILTFIEDNSLRPAFRLALSVLWPIVLPITGFMILVSYYWNRRKYVRKKKNRLGIPEKWKER